LLSFNIGIELGQIAFIALILALGAGFRQIWSTGAPRATPVAIYFMGGMAAMWCIERGMEVLGV
jgi:O-antigen ligase